MSDQQQAQDGGIKPWFKNWKVMLALNFVILGVLLFLDDYLFHAKTSTLSFLDDLHIRFKLFREFGTLQSTILACFFVWVMAKRMRRAIPTILISVIIAGAVAYGLRAVTARERPNYTDGQTVFSGPLQANNPSLPSGHATVAMANASALSSFIPGGRVVFYTMAIGTGLHRVEDGRHFFSDVYLGFIIGFYVPKGVIFLARRRRWAPGRPPLDHLDRVTYTVPPDRAA